MPSFLFVAEMGDVGVSTTHTEATRTKWRAKKQRQRLRRSTRILEAAGKNAFSRGLIRFYYANGFLSSAWVSLSDFLGSEQAKAEGLIGYQGESNVELSRIEGSWGGDYIVRPISFLVT